MRLAVTLAVVWGMALLATPATNAQRCPIAHPGHESPRSEPVPDPASERTGSSVPLDPYPVLARLNGFRLLTAEVDGFMERGRRFRATVEHLADRQEAIIDAGRRRWMIAEPLPTPALTPYTQAPRPHTSPRPREALAAYVAELAHEAPTDVPVTASHIAALRGLATLLEQPLATLGDHPTAGCLSMVARLVDNPSYRPRGANACLAIRRVVDRAEVASLLGGASALAATEAWTPLVPTDARWRPYLLSQMAVDAIQRGDDDTAVILLRVFLSRYPTDVSAPRAVSALARAYRRLGLVAQAAARETDLGDYAPGTTWARTNAGDPTAIQAADAMVSEGLRSAARTYLDLAARYREARDRARTPNVTTVCEHDARLASGNAADTINRMLVRDPLDSSRPGLLALRARELSDAGRDDEAARTYEELREDNDAWGYIWLEQATFRLAISLEHTYAFDEAVDTYHDVATDPIMDTALSHERDRHDALVSVALITTSLGRWSTATAAWAEFARLVDNDDAEHTEVDFHLAEIPYLAGRWRTARDALREFLRVAPTTPETTRMRVIAAYEIAQACGRLGDRVGERQAQTDAAQIFGTSDLPSGSPVAWYVANALHHPGTAPEGDAGWGVMEGPTLPTPALVGSR